MSVELEWELYDIFDSGTFAFPIYDHNSARRIVRYLIMRGILHEEIAEAIEDSSTDLNMWLNRHGKHKIGEWVIAWVNECREEFDRGEMHKMEEGDSAFDRDFFLREDTSESDDHHSDGDDGHGRARDPDRRSDSRITDLDSVISQAGTSTTTADAHIEATEAPPQGAQHELAMLVTDDNKLLPRHLTELPPPPPPPRPTSMSPTPFSTIARSRPRPSDLDLSQHNLQGSTEGLYEAPDSGHFSDLYTSIPSDKILDSVSIHLNNNSINAQCTAKLLSTIGCQFHRGTNAPDGAVDNAPAKCTCSVAHYSYIHNKSGKSVREVDILELPQDKLLFKDSHSYCDIYFGESLTRAMEFNFETLDRDGPGFIFIMTDSIANCLPWSSEHRYKIASSRQPDRCLLEFHARNIEIDLIWQVKVKNHVKATQEIQAMLHKYNLHSNWFKCSLSLIMDTVSRVVKRYK